MKSIQQILKASPYINKKGLEFQVSLDKKVLTAEHNYWLYIVRAEHEAFGNQGYAVFVTKQAYPDEEQADHLAKTIAMEEAKSRLEEVTEEGRPMYLPIIHEGWAIM